MSPASIWKENQLEGMISEIPVHPTDDLWHSKHANIFCVIVIIIGNRGEKLQKAGSSKIN